jgi:hypothetical protein
VFHYLFSCAGKLIYTTSTKTSIIEIHKVFWSRKWTKTKFFLSI